MKKFFLGMLVVILMLGSMLLGYVARDKGWVNINFGSGTAKITNAEISESLSTICEDTGWINSGAGEISDVSINIQCGRDNIALLNGLNGSTSISFGPGGWGARDNYEFQMMWVITFVKFVFDNPNVEEKTYYRSTYIDSTEFNREYTFDIYFERLNNLANIVVKDSSFGVGFTIVVDKDLSDSEGVAVRVYTNSNFFDFRKSGMYFAFLINNNKIQKFIYGREILSDEQDRVVDATRFTSFLGEEPIFEQYKETDISKFGGTNQFASEDELNIFDDAFDEQMEKYIEIDFSNKDLHSCKVGDKEAAELTLDAMKELVLNRLS